MDVEKLKQLAVEARERAYAKYSEFYVGACIFTDKGEYVQGCNVENVSFGATICAERSAVMSMHSQGKGKVILGVAVATELGIGPCGMCLQVLNEFRDPKNGMQVFLLKTNKDPSDKSFTVSLKTSLRELHPSGADLLEFQANLGSKKQKSQPNLEEEETED